MPEQLPPEFEFLEDSAAEAKHQPKTGWQFWASLFGKCMFTLIPLVIVLGPTVFVLREMYQSIEDDSIVVAPPQWKFICDRQLKICSQTYPSATKPNGQQKIPIKNIRYIQSTYQRKRQGTEYYVNLLVAGDKQVTVNTVRLSVQNPEEGKRLSTAISTFLKNPKQQKLEVIYTQGSYYFW